MKRATGCMREIEMHHAMSIAMQATMHELERALLEHPIPKSPTEALMAIRGEVDEVACAISVGDMTGPHGYAAELPQVAAVAIKALMGYVMQQTHVANVAK